MKRSAGGSLRNSLRGCAKRAKQGLHEVLDAVAREDGPVVAPCPQFGSRLDTWMSFQRTICHDYDVPFAVACAIQYIYAHGMNIKGAFRISGALSHVQQLREDVNCADDIDLTAGTADYTHVVCGMLKMYLRELPDPVCTAEKYNDWLACAQPSSDGAGGAYAIDTEKLIAILNSMPEEHVALMAHLLRLCNDLSQNSTINQMTPDNLATCLAPTIIRPVTSDSGSCQTLTSMAAESMLSEIAKGNAIVTHMIKNFNSIDKLHRYPQIERSTTPTLSMRIVHPPERRVVAAGTMRATASPLKRTVSQLLAGSPHRIGSVMTKRILRSDSKRGVHEVDKENAPEEEAIAITKSKSSDAVIDYSEDVSRREMDDTAEMLSPSRRRSRTSVRDIFQ